MLRSIKCVHIDNVRSQLIKNDTRKDRVVCNFLQRPETASSPQIVSIPQDPTLSIPLVESDHRYLILDSYTETLRNATLSPEHI